MRPTDVERDSAIRALQDGCVSGRLSSATFELRIQRALRTKSAHELRQLTVDVRRPTLWDRIVGVFSAPSLSASRRDIPSVWLEGLSARPFVVGRGRDADLILAPESVSRRHLQLMRLGDACLLSDLGSTNGTWLDGRRVHHVQVVPGDVVMLGDACLRML